MKTNSILLLLLVAAVLFSSCQEPSKDSEKAATDPLLAHIDSAYAASEDFFMFSNNGWFKSNPIPASESNNGIFRTIGDTVNEAIRKICESSAGTANAARGSNKQKIGDFYFSGMDTAAIEKAGIQPLAEEIKRIDEINDIPGLMKSVARLHEIGAGPMMALWVNADDKISSKNAIFTMQGGLGLPERDYYFNNDSRTANIRTEYVKHIARMFELAGTDASTAEKNSRVVMEIETALAKASRKLADLRDPYKNYNKLSIAAAGKLTPSINWPSLLQDLGLRQADTLIVGQPEFLSALEGMLKKTSIANWKVYLKWNLYDAFAPYLSKALDEEHFKFSGTIMSGAKEKKPRWKRVVEETDGSLGELIGQVYIEEYLPRGTKEKLLEIGNNIRDVYADHIQKLDWMSDSTKVKALSKLNKVMMKVGYPDKWKDMSILDIDRGPYVLNVMRANQWAHQYMVAKYGKPVDRSEWQMQPQTYNAYYNPSNNEIVVPACNIIVPGYELADDALLYGIIGGSTFGHEITHGFDDQGSQYDENGNLSNWWTAEDRKKFTEKTRLIVEQFNSYKVLDSMHVNGDATQGENIADLGGVVMGYEAFKKTRQGQGTEKIGGLTPDQRYFLGYAYAWMVNRRPEALARQVMSDVHSPAQYRVNGPVSNMKEFYAAFDVKEGHPMYRPDSLRVQIW